MISFILGICLGFIVGGLVGIGIICCVRINNEEINNKD